MEILQALLLQLREQKNNYADDVANGNARTYDEYQKMCGVIKGLQLAEAFAKELGRAATRADLEE